MNQAIEEILRDLEKYKFNKTSELKGLERQLESLQQRREEYFNLVSHDSGDSLSLRKLNETEAEIEQIKQALNDLRNEISQKIRGVKERIIRVRDSQALELQKTLNELKAERERIRSELIPETQRRMDELNERKKELDGKILVLTSEINELQRYDLETQDLES
jgi:DNA anti-recombination protein RmuC